MPVETILFLDNKVDPSNTALSIHSASSTENGYSTENVRDTDYSTAWKPSDSSSDEYIQLDGGAAGFLGNSPDTNYMVIGYDARGVQQTTIRVRTDSGDNPAGAFSENRATFTLNASGPTCAWASTGAASTGRRYWRILQLNSERGGGTKTCPIFFAALYNSVTGVFSIDSDFPGESIDAARLDSSYNVAIAKSVGGHVLTNRIAKGQQDFDLVFDPASLTLWETLRDQFFAMDGPHRAWPIQIQGLRNYALANFQLVRIDGNRWGSRRGYVDTYPASIPLVTEPFS